LTEALWLKCFTRGHILDPAGPKVEGGEDAPRGQRESCSDSGLVKGVPRMTFRKGRKRVNISLDWTLDSTLQKPVGNSPRGWAKRLDLADARAVSGPRERTSLFRQVCLSSHLLYARP
jgi:hypothetical protein